MHILFWYQTHHHPCFGIWVVIPTQTSRKANDQEYVKVETQNAESFLPRSASCSVLQPWSTDCERDGRLGGKRSGHNLLHHELSTGKPEFLKVKLGGAKYCEVGLLRFRLTCMPAMFVCGSHIAAQSSALDQWPFQCMLPAEAHRHPKATTSY